MQRNVNRDGGDAELGEGIGDGQILQTGTGESMLEDRDWPAIRGIGAALNESTASLAPGRFDFAFVDPPWSSDLAAPSLGLLVEGPLLTADHRIYLERPVTVRAGWPRPCGGAAAEGLPVGWETLKSVRIGGADGNFLRLRERLAVADA